MRGLALSAQGSASPEQALQDADSPARVRMRRRWKVALIDEFQDTDPVQWQVLDRAFTGHATMVLIGDPKQAIYAFRGGDIVTYLAAADAARTTQTVASDSYVFAYSSHAEPRPTPQTRMRIVARSQRKRLVETMRGQDHQRGRSLYWGSPTIGGVRRKGAGWLNARRRRVD